MPPLAPPAPTPHQQKQSTGALVIAHPALRTRKFPKTFVPSSGGEPVLYVLHQISIQKRSSKPRLSKGFQSVSMPGRMFAFPASMLFSIVIHSSYDLHGRSLETNNGQRRTMAASNACIESFLLRTTFLMTLKAL